MAGSRYRQLRYLRVSLALVFICGGNVLAGVYGGGSGIETDPFIISKDSHLQELSSNSGDWGMCFKLTADISAASYTPITLFTGVFDGNGHSINGLNYTTDGGYYAGLFCRVEGYGAAVKNLTIISPSFNVPAKQYVGAVAGRLRYGTISNCAVQGGSVRAHSYAGGIAGYNFTGSIVNCFSSASVTGSARTGGITGAIDISSFLTGCIATGNVTGSDDFCGGLVGENLGHVAFCSASGDVTGINYVGGLAGINGQGGAPGTITCSLALGRAAGTSFVGGLVGRNLSGQISDSYAMGAVQPANAPAGGLIAKNESAGSVARCFSTGYVTKTGSGFGGLIGQNAAGSSAIAASFWDTISSGQSASAGGEGKITSQMMQLATFTAAGWDFLGESANGTADKWRLCQDLIDYPGLSWDWPRADIACPDGVEFVDYAILAASWLQTGSGLKGDLDDSGLVDLADLALFTLYWLEGFDTGLPS